MTVTALALTSCGGASRSETPWIVDRFDDIKVIRYEVPGFEQLPLEEKELIYYLAAQVGARGPVAAFHAPVRIP